MNLLKRFPCLLLCSSLVMSLLAGCGGAASAPSSQSESLPAQEAAPSGFTGTLTIVHVNDVHGSAAETETSIGYPKIASYIEEMKRENPLTIALDAGDVFTGNPMVSFDNGESIVPVLQTVGFDAMTVGNADSILGPDRLMEIQNALPYPVLMGNMERKSGKDFLSGHTVLEREGVRVGVIGVTTPRAQNNPDYTYVDAVEKAKELASELRPQVDVLIGLVHLGDNDKDVVSADIARQTEGFDVLIDGHSHTVLEQGEEVNGVLIAQTGEKGEHIGVVELRFEDGVRTGASARLVPKGELAETAEKPETAEQLAILQAKCDEYFAQEIGETTVDLVGTRNLVRTQETNLGNLYADALREKAGTQIAIAAAALIDGEISAGPLTKGDILTIARVSQNLYARRLPGSAIEAYLTAQLDTFPEPSGFFSQVSGLTMKIDKETVTVYDIMVDGEPLDPEAFYTVALPDIGNNALADAGELLGEYGSVEDALEEYIRNNSPITTVIEGRIVCP